MRSKNITSEASNILAQLLISHRPYGPSRRARRALRVGLRSISGGPGGPCGGENRPKRPCRPQYFQKKPQNEGPKARNEGFLLKMGAGGSSLAWKKVKRGQKKENGGGRK